MIYFPTVKASRDSLTAGYRVIQPHDSWGDSQTHTSHSLTGSHTVDSPSSFEVINDFLWLPSNSPSIVNQLVLIEATPLVLSLSVLLETRLEGLGLVKGEVQEDYFKDPLGFRGDVLKSFSYQVCASTINAVSWWWLRAQNLTHIAAAALHQAQQQNTGS